MNHYDSTQPYPRDLIGYGKQPPHAQWPGGWAFAHLDCYYFSSFWRILGVGFRHFLH